MDDTILALDQGTTGTTAMVYALRSSGALEIIGRSTCDFEQHFPQPGWVEHDLEDIWASVGEAARRALKEAEAREGRSLVPRCLGITNQRETLGAFDRRSGSPLARAVVWQCKRSLPICQQLRRDGHQETIRRKTGLVLDPYFSGSKARWMLDNSPEVARQIKSQDAGLATMDAFLVHRLTGGAVFATEASNASRTLLYDATDGRYDDELMALFHLPSANVLPELRDSAGDFGVTRDVGFLPDGIPITGILGDQQAALAGQTCFAPGEAKCTYGTGAFLLANLGGDFRLSGDGLLTTVAWSLDGQRTYALEGACFVAGAAIQFVRDQLGWLPSAPASQELAAQASAAPDVYFVPALAGLGVPYWDPQARGAFLGLTRGTDQATLVRATLEGVALQARDLIEAVRNDTGAPLATLRVDGGAAANDVLMQFQADVAGLTVDRPANLETTALGAAMFAALGAGLVGDLSELRQLRAHERDFTPKAPEAAMGAIRQGWKRAVHAVRVFAGTV